MKKQSAFEPQFRNLKFKNEAEVQKWLKKVKAKKIHFQDKGQDLITMDVHSSGEILNCSSHTEMYAGSFVDMKNLNAGQPLQMMLMGENKFRSFGGLIIEEVCYQNKSLVETKK